jgi:hypothetical protein
LQQRAGRLAFVRRSAEKEQQQGSGGLELE